MDCDKLIGEDASADWSRQSPGFVALTPGYQGSHQGWNIIRTGWAILYKACLCINNRAFLSPVRAAFSSATFTSDNDTSMKLLNKLVRERSLPWTYLTLNPFKRFPVIPDFLGMLREVPFMTQEGTGLFVQPESIAFDGCRKTRCSPLGLVFEKESCIWG